MGGSHLSPVTRIHWRRIRSPCHDTRHGARVSARTAEEITWATLAGVPPGLWGPAWACQADAVVCHLRTPSGHCSLGAARMWLRRADLAGGLPAPARSTVPVYWPGLAPHSPPEGAGGAEPLCRSPWAPPGHGTWQLLPGASASHGLRN